MNAPAAFESFLIFDGERKISVENDTKVPNAAVFTINKEDHTLGNMLKHQLLKDPMVLFAGYKNPHPLEHKILLRVQTTGQTTPADALINAITDLIAELSLFEERFRIYLVVSSISLFILPILSSSGFYDIDEVRSTLYEPDIFSVLAGIDPSFNLSTVSAHNKDSILEKIISDLPTVGDEGYVFIKSKTGQNFACKMPKLQISEKVQLESYNPKYLAELVSASFYIKNCISKDNGWWNYKLCRGKHVKQWHGAKNEAQQITNSLGFFLGKYDVPDYQEHYEGGTLCDLPDKKSPRKTAVRYECDPQLSTSEAYIDNVEEAASCEYVITVKVGSLCSLSAFMPPNLIKPNKITCQPFVSKEAVEKFLEDSIRKRAAKKEAASRAKELTDTLRRIQRRRAAMRRTELLRDSSVEKSALRSYIDNEYQMTALEYIRATLHARLGDAPSDGMADTIDTLLREMDDIDDAFYNFDYLSERDQDAGNLWYYFHDRTWNKTHFPKSLDYVDIMNGYFGAASKLIKNYPDMTMTIRLFKLLRGNPWDPKENLMLHGGLSNNMRSAVLQDIPLFVAPNGDDSLDEELARNVGFGNGLFGFRASSVVNAFMTQVRTDFANGIELVHAEDTIENALGTQLVPAYKYIELQLMEDRADISDDMRKNIETDMVRMLDRLCVAYELSQIRYDVEHPGHKLSFAGVGVGKKANVLFDDYYQSIVKKRSERMQTEIDSRHRQIMTNLLEQYGLQVFHEQWFTMSEMLLYKKREEDALKYGKNSRDLLRNVFSDGRIVLANTDFKEVVSLLNNVGLQVEDMKMEVVTANALGGAPQKITSDEMRLLQEIIKRQMEDLRDIKRITQREQAYANLMEKNQKLHPFEALEEDYYMGDEARGGIGRDSDEELSSDDELQQELRKLAGIKKECIQKRREEKSVKSEFEMDMECELDQLITDYANEHLSGNMKSSKAPAISSRASATAPEKACSKPKENEMPGLVSESDEEDEGQSGHGRKDRGDAEQSIPTKRVRLEVEAEVKTLPKIEEMETDTTQPGSSSADRQAKAIIAEGSSVKSEPSEMDAEVTADHPEKPSQEEAEESNPIKKAARQTMKDVKAETVEFYDPDEDDQNEKWMQQQRRRTTGMGSAEKIEKEARYIRILRLIF
ncbi:PRKCSH domain-containing protein [Trichostrongylus colubriformis]|uniref:Probable DNA-directed RNA polymerase II subunit RPB11 n=1 Tax=Trichostrongylus colubriformis TaxID=6319 RepID=A0AAN8FRB2_TRICO